MTLADNYSSFGQVAQKLVDNGYLPIPIVKGEKRPACGKNWTHYRFKESDADKYAGCGVGILTGQDVYPVGLIDADTRNPVLAEKIKQKIASITTIIRVGEAPKTGYLVLLPREGFAKITSAEFDDGKYANLPKEIQDQRKDQYHRLEILGYGQQFVAYGFHPVTGMPYEYTSPYGLEPLNTHAEKLIVATEEQLYGLVKWFEEECKSYLWKPHTKGSSGQKSQIDNKPLTEFDIDCMRCKDIPLSKAKELLAYIDNDNYDTWREVGMALHLEYAGSREALELWDGWSRNSAKYPEGGIEELKKKWESFRETGKCKAALVRMPSIIAKAEEGRLSIETQMRAAAKTQFVADLEKCSSEYEVEALVRKISAPGRTDREIFTDHVIKRLRALGTRAITKTTVNSWYKRSSYTGYPLNELGLAMRMMDKYKGGLIWDCVNGVPYAWTGSYWRKIYYENMMCCARLTVEEFDKAVQEMKDGSEKEDLKAFVQQCSRPWVWENMIKAFKSFAEGEASVIVHPRDFNKSLRYFGVANGEIDLEKCEFIKSNPAHLITMHSPVAYDPDADAPYAKQKILEMCSGDQELADYVWTLFALAMTGKLKRTFPIFYGTGHNGKSALISIFRRLFGIGDEGYFVTADYKTFMEGKEGNAGGAREDITRLKDKRLVALIESKEGARLNSAAIKQLTGDDAFTARGNYAKHSISFVPCCLPMLLTNHRPIIEDQSEGIWDRLKPIHFFEEFDDDKADPQFHDMTEQELPGVLNTLLGYLRRYREKGLKVPHRVKNDQAKYRASSDPLGEFFDEYCVIDKNLSEVRSKLYQAWKPYARESSVPIFQERKSWFFNALEERGFQALKDGTGIYRIHGIALKTTQEFENLEEEK